MELASSVVYKVERAPQMDATHVSVPRVSCSCLLPLQETLRIIRYV